MSWLLAHGPEVVAGALGVYGWWKRRQAKQAKAEAKRLATELDQIRNTAGTKAPWETLTEQAKAARLRAKPG